MTRSSKSKGSPRKSARARAKPRAAVVAAEEYRRLKGSMTGKALIEAMQASPYREIELAPKRAPMLVQDVLAEEGRNPCAAT